MSDRPSELLPCPFCGGKVRIAEWAKMLSFICETPSACIGAGMGIVFNHDDRQRAIETWNTRARAIDAAATAQGDGWVVVPREATEAMRDAGNHGAAPYMVDAKLLWQQMIAAAPQPPPAAPAEPSAEHWRRAIADIFGPDMPATVEQHAVALAREGGK